MSGVNLIPARRRHARRMQKRCMAWIITALGCGVALTVGCMALRARVPEAVKTDQNLTRVESQIADINTRLKMVSKSATQVEQDRIVVEFLLDQPDWSLLLKTLASKTRDRAVLQEIRLKSSKDNSPVTAAAVGSPAITGKSPVKLLNLPSQFTVELRGFCKTPADVSLFVSDLEKLGLFQKVSLVRTSREPLLGSVAFNFDLECMLSDAGGGK